MQISQRTVPFVAFLTLALGMQLAPAATPRAVIEDPARDVKYPAGNRQLLIPSGDMGMNALLMKASGNGSKPTLVLLHGLPGNEQNLDLAQAVRRAGWNVLTMHYRGSWGSPGTFSIENAVADAQAAMDFLRKPENAAKYNIDARRVFIAGHSMGGFAAARYAATHPGTGLVLIDAWNVGADGKDLQAHPDMRAAFVADLADDFGNSLAGTDPARLVGEIERHASDWDLNALASSLALSPTLVIGASHGNAATSTKLANAIRAQHKGQVQSITIDSDHSFSDHRISLAIAVVNWLKRQTNVPSI